jgi:hypothetical protein
MGCDSIITIDQTLQTIDTSVNQAGPTLTANENGAIYQWLDCNNGFSPIAGETSQSFNINSSGSFAVEISMNGCNNNSSCYSLTIVNVNENSLNEQLKIFPNPNNGSFSIDLGQLRKRADIVINDIQGRLIYSKQYYDQKKINIDMDQAPGIYFLSITINNKTSIKKVVRTGIID